MKTKSPRRRRPKTLRKPGQGQSRNGEQHQPKAILRALDVLEMLPDNGAGLSLAEVSEQMALPSSSVFRILLTLHARGYLQQDDDGTYRLAPKIRAGKLWERSNWLKSIAQPTLQALVGQFEETASLAFLLDEYVRVIDTVESIHDIRVTNKVGRVLPPYASSMAKAITAFQSPRDMARMIEVYGLYRRTDKTKVDRQVIYAEFEDIRTRGYAADRGEAIEGAICLGAPIFLPSGKVEASISIATPAIRFTAAQEERMIPALLQATREIAEATKISGLP